MTDPCPQCEAGSPPVCPGTLCRRDGDHAHTDRQLCDTCEGRLRELLAPAGLPESYVHLYLALPACGGSGERVSGSRTPPVPLSVHVEALMRDIVAAVTTWAEPVAEAARLSGRGLPRRLRWQRHRRTWVARTYYQLDGNGHRARAGDGEPIATTVTAREPVLDVVNPSDGTTGPALATACRTLAAHLPALLNLPPTPVHRWDDEADGWLPIDMDGVDAGLELLHLGWQCRRVLGLTRLVHRLPVPCPTCGLKALTRENGAAEVRCEACGRGESEERYQWLVKVLAAEQQPS